MQLKLADTIELKPGDQLLIEMQQKHKNKGHLVGHFRWSHSQESLAYESPLGANKSAELLAIIKQPEAERKPEQVAQLRTAFQSETPALAELRGRIAEPHKNRSLISKPRYRAA